MPHQATDASLEAHPLVSHRAVSVHFSLYPTVQHARADQIYLHRRPAMRVMSHEIEKHFQAASTPGTLFAGFQRYSNFSRHTRQYQQIAEAGHRVIVFGIPDIQPPQIPGVEYVFLTENHALAREWFVIANSSAYYSALVAEELTELSISAEIIDDRRQQFRGIWTFDETLVTDLIMQFHSALALKPMSPGAGPRDVHQQLAAVALSANHLVTQLEKRNQLLSDNQKMYEDLVSMLIHDLRGSLTSVIGSLEILASGHVDDDEEERELIKNSLDNSRRLAQMISNVLDVNKMEAGHLIIQRDLINLSDLLYDAISRWNVTAQWAGKTLSAEIAQNLPLIVGDTDMLERVIDNLLSNAVKYGDRIRLRASFDGRYVLLSVCDDGPGIPVEDHQRIFAKFTEANLGKAQRKGTGLGLTFSKMAVEAHGGEISIQDIPTGGAEFKIALPLTPPRETHRRASARKERTS
ncbi:MAG: ATP-binding protein [Anaerolineales bacterium]